MLDRSLLDHQRRLMRRRRIRLRTACRVVTFGLAVGALLLLGAMWLNGKVDDWVLWIGWNFPGKGKMDPGGTAIILLVHLVPAILLLALAAAPSMWRAGSVRNQGRLGVAARSLRTVCTGLVAGGALALMVDQIGTWRTAYLRGPLAPGAYMSSFMLRRLLFAIAQWGGLAVAVLTPLVAWVVSAWLTAGPRKGKTLAPLASPVSSHRSGRGD